MSFITIAEAWLKQVPNGNKCDGCDYVKREYMIYGKVHGWWCSTYNLEPKNGMKVEMCKAVWDLEELKHLKEKRYGKGE